MKLKFICLLLLSVAFFSCSSEDNQSEQFEFLEFEKDVLTPFANSGDITFLAFSFDKNLGNWDLKITDENGTNVPVTLDRVESTRISISNKNVQRIAFKAAPKNEGVYTLVIKNKTTNQLYTDHFIVRSKTFNEIVYPYAEDYTTIFAYSSDELKPTEDYFYFHNIKNTIISTLSTTGISGIRLEDVTTFKQYNIDYSVNAETKKIEFIVPVGVPEGRYYLSVRYNNLTEAYFEKDILVQSERLPALTSINKNVFKGGETMVLKGSNFRYKFNLDFLTGASYRKYQASSSLIFKDQSGSGEILLSAYDSDPSFKYMNSEGTEINYPIPRNTSKDDFFFVSVNDGSYFEGTVQVRTGPYISEPKPIRVNFK
ncbi:hypothetical protein [Flavobacterium nitrogenifigens]|uniref:IPT/TIG domain-containing protein n=1 Tax=Flavobacterium nitrogenifigens TaxID=1617283 RepID=A0A521CXF9_9FLAO|nr:hypothetical protein [Flavobacterium nitrogenifigens]KAF2332113.1 hypothetical protein DM397_11310 [Flavobacterium nitrogenifigens]SMO64104.1 hypothetical protein SAMN06265220_102778 [Flavobacterium nitrogenifigens]